MAATSPAFGAVAPHRSATHLVTSNGRVVASYDVPQRRITTFFEHPYRAQSNGSITRDLAFDLYPGLRIGGVGTPGSWLSDVAPDEVAYEPGTNIIRITRTFGELVIDEYELAPIDLDQHALFSLVRVERKAGAAVPIDGFFLFNFHLGEGAPEPSYAAETIQWDAARDAWMEWGSSGLTLAYGSIGESAHHAASPDNPFAALSAGSDLADNAGSGGALDDAAAGTEWSLGALAAGQSAWFGAFVVLDATSNVAPRIDAIRSFIGTRTAEQILTDEKAAWSSWHTPPPADLSALEQPLFQQSLAILRMGQVREPGKGDGQILASLPPGKWNISWVRDMSYATVALARAGHAAEAKRALEFELGAESGKFQDYVGHPYQISITRYFGDGVEETDSNENGPNIEFDGFGLFLWALDEYVRSSNDTASLATWWPVVSEKVADVLVALQGENGLIAPDSSIWEVHWNGQQKRFAYTTIAAANGLCLAASLAEQVGDGARAETYRNAGKKAQAALIAELSAPDGTLAQSREDLTSSKGFLDAAAMEAAGFGLVDPKGRAASATLSSMKARLVPQSGRGFMRNDDGGWYDSQEWVFVDLRTAQATRLGERPEAADLLAWVTAQASENYDLISELHDASTADYAGDNPMVGFGAGAYAIALLDRQNPTTPLPCGQYADESLPDAGTAGTAGAAGAAGSAGASGRDQGDDDGCGCRTRNGSDRASAALLVALGLAFLRRRLR